MNHKQEIENAVKKFRKDVEKIQTSENPIYKDKELVQYEIKQHRAELDATVAELSNAYDKAIAQEIEAAEQKAQASRFYTTEAEKQQSQYALDNYVTDVAMARTENEKYAAYNRLLERIEGMTDGGYAYLRLQLPAALSRLQGDPIATKDLRKVNDAFAPLKTPEQERVAELKAQKVSGADGAYRRLRIIHPAYNDYRDNIARMKN